MCAAFGGLIQAEGAVILQNASFDVPEESEPPECDRAQYWSRWGSWANRHTNQPGWQVRSGLAMVAYHHWQSDTYNAGWWQDITGLEDGGTYTFSVYAQWESDCNASNINMKIEPWGGGEAYATQSYTSNDVGTGWTLISVEGTLPAGITNARVTIECMAGFGGDTGQQNGALKFDDANFQAIPEPASVALIVFGSALCFLRRLSRRDIPLSGLYQKPHWGRG